LENFAQTPFGAPSNKTVTIEQADFATPFSIMPETIVACKHLAVAIQAFFQLPFVALLFPGLVFCDWHLQSLNRVELNHIVRWNDQKYLPQKIP
jgi:hypothetical protein